MKAGFFSYFIYKLDLNCIEALERYKSRDEHEKSFDILKNRMGFYVQRASNEESKEGMSFIAFVGLIIISVLRASWKENLQDKYQSCLDMLDEMESIRLSEYEDGTSHMTTFTMKQVEISRRCGIEPPYECLPQSLKKK